jgi:hypothetical protein
MKENMTSSLSSDYQTGYNSMEAEGFETKKTCPDVFWQVNYHSV